MTTISRATKKADVEGKCLTFEIFTLKNKTGFEVEVMNYGATIISMKYPNSDGTKTDVVLGFDNVEEYITKKNNPYFGATVGRVANRIRNGKFKIDGTEYNVSKNKGEHHLHGGFKGFDKVFWTTVECKDNVKFRYESADGEEGYPGCLDVCVTYTLEEDKNDLIVEIEGISDKTTPINIVNHSYFNLCGSDAGADATYQHKVQINAETILTLDDNLIPTGTFTAVEDTVYDLRCGKLLEETGMRSTFNGFDNAFVINPLKHLHQDKLTKREFPHHLNFVASVEAPTGLTLTIFCNRPAVQFYTSNFFPVKGSGDPDLIGKNNIKHYKHAGFCLETQDYPDSVNHSGFPSTLYEKNQVYRHTIQYNLSKN